MTPNSIVIIPADRLIVIDGSGLYVDFKCDEDILKIEYNTNNTTIYKIDDTIESVPSSKYDMTYYIGVWETEKVRLDDTYKIDIESQQRLIQHYSDVIQTALDNFAATKLYDSIHTACSYSNSIDEQFAKEGQYATVLRDTTWRQGYNILNECLTGIRSIPTEEELLAMLPVSTAKWPD